MRKIFAGTMLAAAAAWCGVGRGDDEAKPEKAAPAALFDQLDKNKDGRITSNEVPEDKQGLFDRLVRTADKDGDGKLNKEELTAGLAEHRPDRPAAERQAGQGRGKGEGPNPERMFKRLDANGDGKITLDEVPDERRPMFEKLMARADKDGDKALSKQELTDGVAAFKQAAGGGLAAGGGGGGGGGGGAQLFKHLDKNGDGKITLDEVPEDRREKFEKRLSRFDKDGDKALSEEEFKAGVRKAQQFQVKAAGKRLGKAGKLQPPAPDPKKAI